MTEVTRLWAVWQGLLDPFAWAFTKGDRLATELLYVPMPDNVVGAIQRLWAAEIRDAGGKPLVARPN